MTDVTMPQLGETEVTERTITRSAQPAARRFTPKEARS
jgi:hypothetical protein